MLTLALDTATSVCTVGLVQDGHVLAEYDISVGLTHSEGLMPQLDQMFARTGIKKKRLTGLLSVSGPVLLRDCVSGWQRRKRWPMPGSVVSVVSIRCRLWPIIFLWPVWCWRRCWMPKKGIIILRFMNGSVEN